MPAKNDLSAFKQKAPKPAILETVPAPMEALEKRGRKAKPESEKESETLALKLTKAEMDALTRNAGMVPKGSYVKHLLRTLTDVFK